MCNMCKDPLCFGRDCGAYDDYEESDENMRQDASDMECEMMADRLREECGRELALYKMKPITETIQ